MLWPAAGLAGVLLARQTAEIVSKSMKVSVIKGIDGAVRSRVRELSLRRTEIGHLEDPAYRDLLEKAGDQGLTWRLRSPGTAATGQLEITARVLSAVLMSAVLAQWFPLLALALLILSLVIRSITRRQWMFLEGVKDAATPERRKVDFWANLALGPAAGTEVRLFGLGPWISERRLEAHYSWMKDYWRIRRTILNRQWVNASLALSAGTLGLGIPGLAALAGELSSAQLTSALVAVLGIFAISVMGSEAFDIEYGKSAVEALRALQNEDALEQKGKLNSPAKAATVRFENVCFQYPGQHHPVFHDLNLTIRPGENLAIVGSNGAGKTTLIKLLAGLYHPTSGRVTVNGTDMRDLDPSGWRRRISVLFQDFVHYPLALRENIRLSAPEAEVTDCQLIQIMNRCGLGTLLGDLDATLDTKLWQNATGGRDLSGGQWQKLAVLRSVFASSQGRNLIVLDEPTANLDVRSETSFFEQIIGLIKPASVVLISHRLSTVRPADRIVFLANGQIIEEGSHDDLIALQGRYATLFQLQASRFEEEGTHD
ncbi:ABC transporter ATP-binding protein [Arthrobacter sp. NtRootA1]|uniref:ABC transporter ATP-binding protein n=1 Tax=Arthrobacter sp. NtRootA1 TaxID=2830983 RepID=UPI001CC3676D|nr:ABC transporter ATP-binding protein [Arthrobacter sp. NtRootA1]BCW08025.1 multidrug ABC transporter permease [Arthrobacter sp. NtRootA1]